MCKSLNKKIRGIDPSTIQALLKDCRKMLDECCGKSTGKVAALNKIVKHLERIERHLLQEQPTEEEIERFFSVPEHVWAEIPIRFRKAGIDPTFAQSFCRDMLQGSKQGWSRQVTCRQIRCAINLLDKYETMNNLAQRRHSILKRQCRRPPYEKNENPLRRRISWKNTRCTDKGPHHERLS